MWVGQGAIWVKVGSTPVTPPPPTRHLRTRFVGSLSMLHRITLLSSDPLASTLPLGLHASDSTLALWYTILVIFVARATASHTTTSRFWSADARREPSGLKASAVMDPRCCFRGFHGAKLRRGGEESMFGDKVGFSHDTTRQ